MNRRPRRFGPRCRPGIIEAGIQRDGLFRYPGESEVGSERAWIWISLEDASLFDTLRTSGATVGTDPVFGA